MTAYRPILDSTPSLAASQNKMLMRAATVVQVLYVLLQLLVVAAIILSFIASFIACFILVVIAPLHSDQQQVTNLLVGAVSRR